MDTDFISVPSGDTPDRAYFLPTSIPQRWRGEVLNWLDSLPLELHPRLLKGLDTTIAAGTARDETETQICRRMLETLRALHRDLPKNSETWCCIRDYLAAGESYIAPPPERPLMLPSQFKDWREFGESLRTVATPLAARIKAVPDADAYADIFDVVVRQAQLEFERFIREASPGMQRHDLDRLLDALGSVETWADNATPQATPPISPISGLPSAPKATPSATTKPLPSTDSGGRITYRRALDIQAKPINWLWPGRIARGKVSMLAGNPGLGKSQITSSMAATVTTGGIWPVDKCRCERGNVIFLSAEDDAEDTIRPRLEAAGADLSRVYILDAVVDGYRADGSEMQRGFNLKTDLSRLGKMLEDIGGAALIVIDPITAYLVPDRKPLFFKKTPPSLAWCRFRNFFLCTWSER